MPNLPSGSKTPISKSRYKSVFLREWWLIKVESKLGVGGFVNRETRGMQLFGSASTGKRSSVEDGIQLFGSAAIAKRHDSSTIEAVDGIIIRISGCINKSRTLSYGFSPEVCDSFFSGFPFTWGDYACISSHDKSLPASFDDLPVTRVRDLLMSGSDSRALNSIIFRDILKHTEKILEQSFSSVEKVCKNSTETEADHNQDDDDDDVSLSIPTQETTEEDYKIPVDVQLEISKETEVDHNQHHDVSLSNPVQKITEEDYKIPVGVQLEETEDGGCMLGKINKVTRKKKLKELPRRNSLRSIQKRKRTRV